MENGDIPPTEAPVKNEESRHMREYTGLLHYYTT
jgi:hypothetical protein